MIIKIFCAEVAFPCGCMRRWSHPRAIPDEEIEDFIYHHPTDCMMGALPMGPPWIHRFEFYPTSAGKA